MLADEADLDRALGSAVLVAVAYDSRTTVNGETDDSRSEDAVRALLARGVSGPAILLSSQVRAGTCERLLRSSGLPADSRALVHVPENLRLGSALEDFLHPERLVVGCNAPDLPPVVAELVAQWNARDTRRVRLVEAELVKHGTNVFLSMCIVFANDLGWIARELGADPVAVMEAVRADSRVSPKAPLRPGQAYAGATPQRDVRALWEAGEMFGRDTLFAAVSRSNASHALAPVALLDRILDGLYQRRVCLLGLTYKPGITTLRDSPALRLAKELTAFGCTVTAHDPHAEQIALDAVDRRCTVSSAATDADCVVLVTAHEEYLSLDLGSLSVRRTNLLDLCAAAPSLSGRDGWRLHDMWGN
ncbi:UDP binding domain-containing protein [Brachybacterium sp. GPGPB12]|uniref:UDP binding domain-containing protein n=1 Tax=Brachybacterium sp. GPGPB12 TaxID=3023517 RepID=UPI0031345BD2